jgi:hypothetical protein
MKKRHKPRSYRCFLEINGKRILASDPDFPTDWKSHMEGLLNGTVAFVAAPKQGDLLRRYDRKTKTVTIETYKPRSLMMSLY